MRLGLFLSASLLAATIFLVPTARGGPNEGGTLILHAMPYVGRTPADICSQDPGIATCGEASTDGLSLYQNFVMTVFCAFPDASHPRLKGVTFGLDYDDNSTYPYNYYELCGDFELTDANWPGPGSGNAITWGTTQTDHLVRVYSFIGYAYYDDRICLTPHPVQGGNFADDSLPSQLDPIVDYGCLGFGIESGYLPCPGITPTHETTWGAIKGAYR